MFHIKDDKERILQNLCDMFSQTSPDEIKRICEDCGWILHNCIDALIAASQQGAVPHISTKISLTAAEDHHQPEEHGSATQLPVAFSPEEQQLLKRMSSEFRVMVIMRGAPGSGKSHLAQALLENCVHLTGPYTSKEFILSTDDFFCDDFGNYRFNIERLATAHSRNQNRAREKAAMGWSPIIIDNTNIELWEMLPYARIALRYGYALELLEPSTSWRFSAGLLALKNKHGVSRDKIQSMLDKYEKTSADDLMRRVQGSITEFPLRPRLCPPSDVFRRLNEDKNGGKENTNKADIPVDNGSESCLMTCTAKRSKNIDKNCTLGNESSHNEASSESLGKTLRVPIDRDRVQEEYKKEEETHHLKPKENVEPAVTTALLDLLREHKQSLEVNAQPPVTPKPLLERHTMNCPEEHPSFVCLRQMYVNKELNSLWDLFVKCAGDVDWAVDILLKEEDLKPHDQANFVHKIEDTFVCGCKTRVNQKSTSAHSSGVSRGAVRPQGRRRAKKEGKQNARAELEESIKKRVTMSDAYSRRLSRTKRGSFSELMGSRTRADVEVQTVDAQENIESDLIELSLNDVLVHQLMGAFKTEVGFVTQKLPEHLLKQVFVPKPLAKELYILWMESVYNQQEEERQVSLREDEEFARLLKYPEYQDYQASPPNTPELLDMKMAQLIHETDVSNEEPQVVSQQPINLATHLSHMRLGEMFPGLSREVTLEVLTAHGNQFNETIQALQQLTGGNEVANTSSQMPCEHPKVEVVENTNRDSTFKPEKAVGLALEEFERVRNLAVLHSQLKVECQQKARAAYKAKNLHVAMHYSQQARRHQFKIDVLNQRAAALTVDKSRENSDVLDLHHLYVKEAIECLDVFVDRHITGLRTAKRYFKHVFIITGRGLHSASGVSYMKSHVKNRLVERGISWSQENPGLLKAKIFSTSRYGDQMKPKFV